MKRFQKIFVMLIALATLIGVLSISTCAFSQTATQPGLFSQLEPNEYPENSRERFVASLARKHNISYEAADRMEQQSASAPPHGYDEGIGYQTIHKKAGTLKDHMGTYDVNIEAQVQYVYNRATGEAISIEDVVTTTVYLPDGGVSNYSFSNTAPAEEIAPEKARVSCTTVVCYDTVASYARTFATFITLSDLS